MGASAAVVGILAMLLSSCASSRTPPRLAPIVVESPTPDEEVPATFTVSGSASVFEATLVAELVHRGRVVERRTVTASEGAPGRGTFKTTLHATFSGPAVVVAFAPNAAGGPPQHVQRVRVTVRP